MLQKKKLYLAISILALCILLVASTFAWTNFSASIVNRFFGSGNGGGNEEPGPGGTLHNDFEEGKDYRDIYVENWGTEPLIVRIRLTEYMEIGEGAGNKNGAENNQATSIVYGASIDDPSTWTPFNGDMEEGIHRSSNGFRYYWNWTMGGQKRFFLAPEELRGTQDENGVEFVSTTSPVGNADDIPTVYRLTLDAEVFSMAEWIDMDRPLGHYWVVDEDGYSYWAAPLEPEEATGLLLHKVELNNRLIEDFYYAINVVAHMATIDDSPDNYEKLKLDASVDAITLINQVADSIRGKSESPVAHFNVESIGRPRVSSSNIQPVIFQSKNEAHDFYNTYQSLFSLFGSHWSYIEEDKTLIDDRFDDAFFDERALLFVPSWQGISHVLSVVDVFSDGGILVVETNIYRPDGDLFMHDLHYFIINICRSLLSEEISEIMLVEVPLSNT